MEFEDIRLIAKAVIRELDEEHSADLAPKWENGTIIFKPKDSTLKEHEMQIDKILHKVVMIRDNLRVLEQQINSSSNLSEGEKIKFQAYITKCYGSMTSFNFMFKNEEDKF